MKKLISKTQAKKEKKRKPMEVPITHPDFFKKLGTRGGSATKANNPPDYFARIAVISHQIRRENAARLAKEAAAKNGTL